MTPTVFQISVAIFMAVVCIALVVWIRTYINATSEWRMMHMLERAGLDPEIATSGDTEAIIREVRSRCRKCQTEDLCERWLAGEEKGENTFCPNANIFRSLARTAGHAG